MKHLKLYEDIFDDWDEEEEVPNENMPTDLKRKEYFKYKGRNVRIREDSNYYTSNSSNPRDTDGIIVSIDNYDSHIFKVHWDNGGKNSYRAKDLKLID
jgi:hypothetical protein